VKHALAVVGLVVGLTVAAIAAVAAFGSSDGSDGVPFRFSTTTTLSPEQQTARAWNERAISALRPLTDLVAPYVTDTRAWTEGTVATEHLRASLAEWAADVAAARSALADVGAPGGVPVASPAYDTSAALYAEVIRVSTAALDVPAGPVRDEVVRLAQRLRILGDRVFDRGRGAVALVVPESAIPDVEVRRPEEVPSWPAEQLAVGPPLDAAAPPASETFPPREEGRPTQPRASWVAAVSAAGTPSLESLRAAVATRDAGGLAELARRAEAAAESLRAEPDPADKGGREESARVRLGFLVRADAARAAQAASLVEGPAASGLREAAAALVELAAGPVFELDGA
jgi:hypothetical protein